MSQEQVSNAYIVIHKDALVGKRVELWKECTTIGRSRDRDIFLEDLAVHRKQASIRRTDSGYVLFDDHGSGDSFVNDKPISEQLLNSGDQLLFGNTRLTFFASEGTRPFQLPSSRGRELYHDKAPDPQATVPARLDFINEHTGSKMRSIELMSEISIGRSRTCNIFLEDLAVSRLHATVHELPGGEYELLDNHSATGTFINGRPTLRCVLHEGDSVQIGSNTFVFRHKA